jgi:hypothetical protein
MSLLHLRFGSNEPIFLSAQVVARFLIPYSSHAMWGVYPALL